MTDQRNKSNGSTIGMVLGAIVLIVVAVAFFTYDGFMPESSDATGAIGVAKKYQGHNTKVIGCDCRGINRIKSF